MSLPSRGVLARRLQTCGGVTGWARACAAVAGPALGTDRYEPLAVVLAFGITLTALAAFGPNVLAGELAPLWLHLVAPTLGGVLAAVLYDRVLARGKPPE